MASSQKFVSFVSAVLAASLMLGCSHSFTSGFNSGRERARGQRLFKEGKYEEAAQHFRKAIELYPSGPGYAYLGMTLEKMGSYNEAAENLNKAIDKFDAPTDKRPEIIKLRKLTGAPTLGEVYGHAASVYLKLKNLELAQSYNKKAIELEPKVGRNFCVSAQIQHTLKNDKQAVSDANRAIDMDPHDFEAYHARSISEFSLGKYRSSLEDSQAALAINADDQEMLAIKKKAEALASKQKVKH